MPAAAVTDDGVALYERYFGAPFSAFDYRDCRFVLINSPVLNSGLAGEDQQRAWLEDQLAASDGKRVFLFGHYPPYILDPAEPPNYDNIDEPQRSWLLSMIDGCGVEALFAGHVHNFFYHRHGNTDCYLLPATAVCESSHRPRSNRRPWSSPAGARIEHFAKVLYNSPI